MSPDTYWYGYCFLFCCVDLVSKVCPNLSSKSGICTMYLEIQIGESFVYLLMGIKYFSNILSEGHCWILNMHVWIGKHSIPILIISKNARRKKRVCFVDKPLPRHFYYYN